MTTIGEFKKALVAETKPIQANLDNRIGLKRYMSSCAIEVQRNERLMEAITANPVSVVQACVIGSKLGIELGEPLGHAYLVPFKDKRLGMICQLIVGYKGWIHIISQHGYDYVDMACVHVLDHFECTRGTSPKLLHSIDMRRTARGEVIAVYAVVARERVKHFEVMSPEEIEKHRDRSKSGTSGPWTTDWEAMAQKTVLLKLCKRLPLGKEFAVAVSVDQDQEQDPVDHNDGTQPILETGQANPFTNPIEPSSSPLVNPESHVEADLRAAA